MKLHSCQWLKFLVCWSRYRHYFCYDNLWSVDSCYWQRHFTALQVQSRYDRVIHKWNWGSCITYCQQAQAVVFILQFDAHNNLPCVLFVATAFVASEAPVAASFFEKSLCKWFCIFVHNGAHYKFYFCNPLTGAKWRKWKHNLNFCTCSRRSFSFSDLNFSQYLMACFPSLNGRSEIFDFVESSALEAKVLVFGFLQAFKPGVCQG